jgi:spore germination protein YaaH
MKIRHARKSPFLLAVFLFISNVLVVDSSFAAQPRKILTGWIPYYQMKTSLPSALTNSDLIKEVMPFWYSLKITNGNVTITDLYSPANPSVPMAEPLTAIRNAGYKIIPTITDGTAKLALAKFLANPENRAKAVAAITNLISTNGFDGIDLDFENFAFLDGNASWPTTKPNWVLFVNELAAAVHAQQKLLSITTPYLLDPATGKQGYYVYAWADISPVIDRLRIMTYDYSVSKPGPIGPLSWIEDTLSYAVKVIPASKIYLGLAGYGRDWVTSVSGVCPSNVASVVKVGAKAATFIMSDAVALASSYGAVPTYNEQFGEVTFSYQKTYNGTTTSGLSTSCTANRTAWYQDSRSYLARAQLVAKYRLGGVTAWTLGMEDPLAMSSIRQVATSIAPDEIVGNIAISAEELGYGQVATLSGIFTLADKAPVSGLPVKIEVKANNDQNWREIGQLITNQDGNVNTQILLGKNQQIRLRSEGTWERLEGMSPAKNIKVKPVISINAPISVLKSQLISITGNISSKISTKINLEIFVGNKWNLVQSTSSDENGNYLFNTGTSVPGFVKYRTNVLESDSLGAATSSAAVVVIRE